MKKGDTVYFWWSCSYYYMVKFVEWKLTRRGVCAVVESEWLFDKCIMPKIPHGYRRGQAVLQPHTDLYRSSRAAEAKNRKIRRPSAEQLRRAV